MTTESGVESRHAGWVSCHPSAERADKWQAGVAPGLSSIIIMAVLAFILWRQQLVLDQLTQLIVR